MNFKKNQGFTLVELIVVIAILGLLAGIGIPAYSGYVEKAQIAVEEQNIAMFHNAYVVACVGNGIDPERYTPSLDWRDGNFYGLTAIQQRAGENPTVLAAAEFNAYFGFDGTKFYSFKHKSQAEVADGIKNGVATEGTSGGSKTVEYTDAAGNKHQITLNQQQIDALNNSTFMTNNALGVDGLTDKLDFVTTFAKALLGEDGESNPHLDKVKADPTFLKSFAGYLNIDPATIVDGNYAAAIGKWADDHEGADLEGMMSNALVLYAAQNTTMSKADATALLGTAGSDPKQAILGTLNTQNDAPTAMAQAALAYGMFTSYAYQSGDENLIKAANSEDPLDVMDYLNDDGFKAYINDPNKGGKDLDGYLSAMGMITDGTQNNQVANDVLNQGFNNNNLEGLLNNALGKNTSN